MAQMASWAVGQETRNRYTAALTTIDHQIMHQQQDTARVIEELESELNEEHPDNQIVEDLDMSLALFNAQMDVLQEEKSAVTVGWDNAYTEPMTANPNPAFSHMFSPLTRFKVGWHTDRTGDHTDAAVQLQLSSKKPHPHTADAGSHTDAAAITNDKTTSCRRHNGP